jgi:hypothetical protein
MIETQAMLISVIDVLNSILKSPESQVKQISFFIMLEMAT